MKEGGGAEVRILTPEGDYLMFVIHFECSLSNNKVEYKAILNTI